MRVQQKLTILAVVTLTAAGCTQQNNSLIQKPNLKNQYSQRVIHGLHEVAPPKILPETHYSAARLFESRGDLTQAIMQYRKAVAVNHKFFAAYHRLGVLKSIRGEREEALVFLRRAMELRPEDAVVRNNLGFELMLHRDLFEAESQFRKAIELEPYFARAYINLGLVQGKMGRFDEALASFRKVLPEVDAYYNLGLIYRAQRRFDDAAYTFNHVLELNPNFTAAFTQLKKMDEQRMLLTGDQYNDSEERFKSIYEKGHSNFQDSSIRGQTGRYYNKDSRFTKKRKHSSTPLRTQNDSRWSDNARATKPRIESIHEPRYNQQDQSSNYAKQRFSKRDAPINPWQDKYQQPSQDREKTFPWEKKDSDWDDALSMLDDALNPDKKYNQSDTYKQRQARQSQRDPWKSFDRNDQQRNRKSHVNMDQVINDLEDQVTDMDNEDQNYDSKFKPWSQTSRSDRQAKSSSKTPSRSGAWPMGPWPGKDDDDRSIDPYGPPAPTSSATNKPWTRDTVTSREFGNRLRDRRDVQKTFQRDQQDFSDLWSKYDERELQRNRDYDHQALLLETRAYQVQHDIYGSNLVSELYPYRSYGYQVVGFTPYDLSDMDYFNRGFGSYEGENSSIDSWAVLRELEFKLAVVRNDLDCVVERGFLGNIEGPTYVQRRPFDYRRPKTNNRFEDPFQSGARLLSGKEKKLQNKTWNKKARPKTRSRFYRRPQPAPRNRQDSRERRPRRRNNRSSADSPWEKDFVSLKDLLSVALNEIECDPNTSEAKAMLKSEVLATVKTRTPDEFTRFEFNPEELPQPSLEELFSEGDVSGNQKRVNPKDKKKQEIHGQYGHYLSPN